MKRLSIIKRDNFSPSWLKRHLVLVLMAFTASFAGGLTFAQSVEAAGTGGPVTGVAGRCLANKDGVVVNGNPIQLEDCNSSAQQTLRWEGNLDLKVQGFCLDAQAATPGAVVRLWTCNNTAAQKWYKNTSGQLVNKVSNLCLDTVGDASAVGTRVELDTCNVSTPSQQWTISSDAIVLVPLTSPKPHNTLPPGPYTTPMPTITLDTSMLPQFEDYGQQILLPLIKDWYRVLGDYYAQPDHAVRTSFTVKYDPTVDMGASATTSNSPASSTININPIFNAGTDAASTPGLMIHEMMHIVVYNPATSTSGLPTWLNEAWADHARYYTYHDDNVTVGTDTTFASGYRGTPNLLDHIENSAGASFVKGMLSRAWNGTYNYNAFKDLTGKTAAEHWRDMTSRNVTDLGAITHALSGKCLDLPGGATADGTRMQLWTCNNTVPQDWIHMAPSGSQVGSVSGPMNTQCLSVIGDATASGTGVEYRGCNTPSKPGQKWQHVGGTIRNPNSGKCLQPVGGAQTSGTQMEIQPCDGSLVQQWTLPTMYKDAAPNVTSKVLYPATFSDGQQGIGTTDAKGGGYNRILTPPANSTYVKPSLSPNGNLVAYFQTTTGQPNVTLRKANADGTSSAQLTVSGHFMTTSAPKPVWSADNSKILVATTPTGQTATDKQWTWLWVNVDGSGQQVVSATVIGGTPFAATNGKIYFVNDGAGEQQLCSVNDTNGSGEACFGSAAVPKATALSPDGTRVASLATGTTTSVQVTSVGASTSSVSLSALVGLTNVEDVTWVPNTTKVAFRAVVSGKTSWYAIDAVSPGQISKLNIDASPIAWYANGVPTLSGAYTAVAPFRITDTRTGFGGLNAGKTLGPGGKLDVQVAGLGGVPAEGASAVVLNVTVAAPTAESFISAYPTGVTQPNASIINTRIGKDTNNQTTVGLGNDGKVTLYNNAGNSNLIVDVVGYFSENGGSFVSTEPKRIIDTRVTGGTLATGSTRTVQVTGVMSIPADAVAVVADVTTVSATNTGYLTLYPTGGTLPLASSVNHYAGENTTKEVNVRLGTGGALNVFSGGGAGNTHFIIDVVGYYSNDMSGLAYTPITPSRIADTRAGFGGPYAGQTMTSGLTKTFAIGSTLMPANAAAIVNNMTVLSPSGTATYLTSFPANVATVPGASTLTYIPPIAFNQNTVQLSSGPTGGFKVYNNSGTADVILDSLGYYY